MIASRISSTHNLPSRQVEGWEYSDTNYIVLGMIIEQAGGAPYYDQLRGLLKKHGLTDTVPADSRIVPGLVQGYAGANNPFGGSDEMIKDGKFAVNPQFEWTGGGLATTALDLARWAKLLYEGKVVDPSLMDDLLDGVPAKLGPETKYGLAVIIRPTAHGITYGHSGFMPGYQTDMMYFPADEVGDCRAGQFERATIDGPPVIAVRHGVRGHSGRRGALTPNSQTPTSKGALEWALGVGSCYPRQNNFPSCDPITNRPDATAGEADNGPPASNSNTLFPDCRSST